jgi:cell division protein FtsQ
MGRRTVTEDADFVMLDQQAEPPAVSEERAPRRSPRSSKKEKEESAPKRRSINLFYWAIPFFALAGAFVVVIAFHRVEAFLINDQRFHLPAATDYGQDPPNLALRGMERASKAEILRVFEKDMGRSLYLFPIAERRRNLLAVDWVKDATVSRRWPNQIQVQIVERRPAAFAQISGGPTPNFRMIDTDGVLLPIPKGQKFENYAVLTGFSGQEPEGIRKPRVQQAVAMLNEIGPLSAYISELDVRDSGNFQATVQLDKAAVMVRLGSKNYRTRLQNFLQHYPRIHEQRPDARVFDLRIDDRITAVEGDKRGE